MGLEEWHQEPVDQVPLSTLDVISTGNSRYHSDTARFLENMCPSTSHNVACFSLCWVTASFFFKDSTTWSIRRQESIHFSFSRLIFFGAENALKTGCNYIKAISV